MREGTYFQHTIGKEVGRQGIGLHSGSTVSLKIKPAPEGYGIRFRRVDVGDHCTIPATLHRVVDTRLATTIGFDGVVVSTIEHLMAALAAAGVDNAVVELDGPEVPIFDGSADSHVRMLKEAGLRRQQAPRRYLRVAGPVTVREGESYIKATPHSHFFVRYTIDFPHPMVGRQEFSWSFDQRGFGRDIAQARTFGFLREVEYLKSQGLARGGSLANAMVFDDQRLLNDEGFRYADECVRHKVLDLVGDMALAGMPLLARIEAHKAGHALHCRFLKQLLAEPRHCAIEAPIGLAAPCFQAPTIPGLMEPFPPVAKAL